MKEVERRHNDLSSRTRLSGRVHGVSLSSRAVSNRLERGLKAVEYAALQLRCAKGVRRSQKFRDLRASQFRHGELIDGDGGQLRSPLDRSPEWTASSAVETHG